jgi:two-component system, chemotaxis family, CheB/CheR fusion protein
MLLSLRLVRPRDARQLWLPNSLGDLPARKPPHNMNDSSFSESFSARPSRPTMPVIGIGASAGGLESLQRFFDRCPADTGFAFVVIQHLSPNFKTLMDTLLARRTSMPVTIAEDHERVLANHVYLIPPKKDMILSSGQLLLGDKQNDRGVHLPIDRFLVSIANELGDASCGIILSGTGSDGSRGIQEIKAAGGLVLCESEDSAKFTGMPSSARATGCVDQVLPCESMPQTVVRHFSQQEREDDDSVLDSRKGLPCDMERLYQLLHEAYRVDFSHYKPKTILRRLDRRMGLMDLADLNDYLACLDDQAELRALYADMLIGVTRFFRDEPLFERLEQEIIPQVIRNHAEDDPLRIWVPGCATGEEAYSIAMLVHERLRLLRRKLTVKIFATDVHAESLAKAGAGQFAPEKVADLSAERLERYFERRDQRYQISKELREMIVFARHNVIEDAPFTQLDLISCRNLLIYFRAAAQHKALSLFHFALKTRGYLVLGPSESPGELGRDFETIDSHSKIYMKRNQKPLPPDVPMPNSVGFPNPIRSGYVPYRPSTAVDAGMLEIYDGLLDRFMPPAMLVNDSRELLETFGGAEQLLRVKSRRASRDVVDMLDGELRTMIAGGLRQVGRSKEVVQFPTVTVTRNDGERQAYRISIERIASKNGPEAALIVFHPSNPPGAVVKEKASIELVPSDGIFTVHPRGEQPLRLPVPDAVRNYLDTLEDELHFTKENLQTTIEELEASNEELQATNEEIVASNEELQSTNEELNSVNEELHTVNTEYQNTIREMRDLNEDMNQLLASTEIGTLFLDGRLVIRRFTPGISQLFDLVPQDVGRPLSAFAYHLDMPDLLETLAQVLEGGERYEREVRDDSGHTYFLRALPYGTGEDHGLVVTFTDIQGLIDAKASLRASELRLTQLIDAVPVLMSLIDRHERYVMVNKAYSRVWQIPQGEIVGKHIRDLIGADLYGIAKPHIDQVLRGETVSYELTLQEGCGEEKHYLVNYVPHLTESGEVLGFFTAMLDMSDAKAVERSLASAREAAEHANRAKSDFLANMSHEIRSPLTSILGFADILSKQLVDADNRNCADLIQRNGQHLLDLINDILDLSKIEAGRFEIEKRRFSPVELIDEVIESFSFRARQNKLFLRRRQRGAVPQTILSDPTRLRQVLINLVGNALKFTREGGVIVGIEQRDDKLQIQVKDTGSGIAEHQIREVFHPFNQTDNSLTREHEGTGLGLAISQRIVTLLGGTLELESELGSGATFTFCIDIGPLDKVTLVSTNIDPTAAELDAPDDSIHLDACILVVDDRRDIRYLVEHFLSEAGARVATAKDGAEALDLLSDPAAQKSTDLVVMDIQMPGLDGYETARRLRKFGYRKPILALSAGAMKGDREKAISAGCNDYLSKPINGPQLVTSVSQLLREE